jgi:hypothetical protein
MFPAVAVPQIKSPPLNDRSGGQLDQVDRPEGGRKAIKLSNSQSTRLFLRRGYLGDLAVVGRHYAAV